MQLTDGAVTLRPLRLRDGPAWVEVRQRNEAWLQRWEATPPGLPDLGLAWHERQSLAVFAQMIRTLRRQTRDGAALPFAVLWEGRFAGQLTIGNIVRGAFNNGHAGYWVDSRLAGRRVMPTALALAVDHCFGPGRLHRIQADVRPENTASRRVMEKLGFREEALHERYLSIDGAYRDHIGYALTTEDVPEGLLNRWRRVRAQLA